MFCILEFRTALCNTKICREGHSFVCAISKSSCYGFDLAIPTSFAFWKMLCIVLFHCIVVL